MKKPIPSVYTPKRKLPSPLAPGARETGVERTSRDSDEPPTIIEDVGEVEALAVVDRENDPMVSDLRRVVQNDGEHGLRRNAHGLLLVGGTGAGQVEHHPPIQADGDHDLPVRGIVHARVGLLLVDVSDGARPPLPGTRG